MSVDERQFGFHTERVTTDAVYILRWLHELYHAGGIKLYMFFGPRESF